MFFIFGFQITCLICLWLLQFEEGYISFQYAEGLKVEYNIGLQIKLINWEMLYRNHLTLCAYGGYGKLSLNSHHHPKIISTIWNHVKHYLIQ